MGPHPGGLQKNQAAHSGQWDGHAADHPTAGGREPHHPGAVAQQEGEEAGPRSSDAGVGLAQSLVCGG